jgi:hypothetical protein
MNYTKLGWQHLVRQRREVLDKYMSIIKTKCNSLQRQSNWKVEQEWERYVYIDKCNLKQRNGLAWFKMRIQKLRGKTRGAEKERYSLRNKTSEVHILLKCNEIQSWRKGNLDKNC